MALRSAGERKPSKSVIGAVKVDERWAVLHEDSRARVKKEMSVSEWRL